MALNKAKVFTVTSVKGGVGKTTFLLNLAAIFKRLNKNVLIVDLDLYCGDIASTLNIPNALDIYNLFEDINNNKFDNFDNYVTKYSEGIDVLPSPKDPRFARKISSKVLDIILYKAGYSCMPLSNLLYEIDYDTDSDYCILMTGLMPLYREEIGGGSEEE